MENKAHALAAGAFVLAVTALLIGLAMWLLRDEVNTTTYEMVSAEAVSGTSCALPFLVRAGARCQRPPRISASVI